MIERDDPPLARLSRMKATDCTLVKMRFGKAGLQMHGSAESSQPRRATRRLAFPCHGASHLVLSIGSSRVDVDQVSFPSSCSAIV